MKLASILAAGMLAAIATLPVGAQAVSEADKARSVTAPAARMQTDTPTKPASVTEETTAANKAAAPQSATDAGAERPDPSKDRKRHLHPRDGK